MSSGRLGEEAADRDGERRLAAEDARVRGAVQRREIEDRAGHPGALGEERPPLLAEHLTGADQLHREARPRHAARTAGVDHVLEEGRVAEQDGLLEHRGEALDDAQDVGLHVARRHREDRVAAAGEVTAARGGEHAADPGSERKADDRERRALVGAERVDEHLLEPGRDRDLVGDRTRPEPRLAGRARRDRDRVAAGERPAAAARRQRMAVDVALLGDEWQAREVVGVDDRRGVDAVLGEEGAIRGHLARAIVEKLERARRRVAARAQPVVEGLAMEGVERGAEAVATGVVEHADDDSAPRRQHRARAVQPAGRGSQMEGNAVTASCSMPC